MNLNISKLFLLLCLVGIQSICMHSTAYSQKIAFPTAEGYGKYTVGGRGGKVIEVTNLNDAGTGSLRAAIEASGARTVVFRVSGTITLNSALQIKNPYITIAGQTAPGDGICIKKYPLEISADEVIIRYIRVRFGNETTNDADAVSCRFTKNLIVDHVSASWSVDEVMSIYHSENVTVQWCLVGESLYNAGHVKGAHGFGGIWGATYATYHHNLIAHNSSRNCRFASGSVYTDFRNNVIYNWGYNSSYGGENQQVGDANYSSTNINMVANYYKPGPATQPDEIYYRIVSPDYRDVKTDYGKWYIADNVMVGNSKVTANNWDGGVQPKGGSGDLGLIKQSKPWAAMAINQQTAEQAYLLVLDKVGANLPKRDAVDTHIINDARTGTATYEGAAYETAHTVKDKSKKCGIIDSHNDVGGWPVLNSTSAPTDSDHDGMPDAWETANGLKPAVADDRNAYTLNADYTNLEVYLNSMLEPVSSVKYSLTSSVTGQGTVSPASGSYASGTSVSVTATPASGWEFSQWQGASTSNNASISVTMDGNKSLSAVFVQSSVKQSISLQKGWNLISTNVHLTDSTIATVFKGVDVQEIKTMDAFWRKGQAEAFNGLKTITSGKGYLVNMNAAGTLTVTGTPIAETQNISGLQTWQLIGCPYQTAKTISTIFNATNSLIIKNFDGFWIPNGTTNSLQNMESGKGYFIKK